MYDWTFNIDEKFCARCNKLITGADYMWQLDDIIGNVIVCEECNKELELDYDNDNENNLPPSELFPYIRED